MKSKNYEEFVEKFKPKLTTDDCYTPEPIYEVVVKYCEDRYEIKREDIIRPFYPGGDYESEDYTGRVVVDNPPFSILTKIVRFYTVRQIPFFLFAPSTTLFQSHIQSVTYIAVYSKIVYHNGAAVNTSFITNLEPGIQCRSDPELYNRLKIILNKSVQPADRAKYIMPDEIITAMKLGYLSKYGVEFSIPAEKCKFVRNLESMKNKSKKIFGGAFILSPSITDKKIIAESIAKDTASKLNPIYRWELSDDEKEQSAALDK